jgi:hypothetical protein
VPPDFQTEQKTDEQLRVCALNLHLHQEEAIRLAREKKNFILYIFLGRFFVRGLLAGSVKG